MLLAGRREKEGEEGVEAVVFRPNTRSNIKVAQAINVQWEHK